VRLEPIRLAIVTISDGVNAGARKDASGDAIASWAAQEQHDVVQRKCLPDETPGIAALLVGLADGGDVDVILTTGGTGFTRRDVTPEATQAVIERAVPGIAEAIRARGASATPYAYLSRGIAGIRASTLIVNLPGSESGVRDGLQVLGPLVRHAVQLLRDIETGRHNG
jgi:molybdenum cofactor synthesis domain-containing protein